MSAVSVWKNRLRRFKASVDMLFSLNRYLVGISSGRKCGSIHSVGKYYLKPANIPTPELANMPVFKAARHIFTPSYRYPELYTAVFDNAIFCTDYNVVLCADGKIIAETSDTMHESKYFGWKIIKRKPSERIVGLSTPLRSVSNNYYHVIIDLMPRIYALNHHSCGESVINVLYSGKLSSVEKFWLARILPANARLKEVRDGTNYVLEKYLFLPFITRQFAGFHPSEYIASVMPRILPKRKREKHKRIYISRRNAAYRRVLNEDQLIQAVAEYGFSSYCLEELTVDQQIELFYDAEFVISAHGAGLTNLVYSERCRVLEIFAMKTVKPSYYSICQSYGHEYMYICSGRPWINDDFKVDIVGVRNVLKQYCGN